MKYECDVIEDLLPLYKDGACSPASAKAVEEHLTECPRCSEMLARMNDITIDEMMISEKENVIGSQTRYFKRRSTLVGSVFAGIFALPILVCLIVNLATGHGLSWFFIVLAAMLIPASLTVVPMLARENRFFLSITSFAVSLLTLLGVVCLYTGGKWFFVAASACLFGLTVLFGPMLAAKSPLRERLGRSKGLTVMAASTVTFFVMMLCIGLFAKAAGYYRLALGISVPVVAMVWVLFLLIRYLPVGKTAKTGLVIAAVFGAVRLCNELIVFVMEKTLAKGEVMLYTQTPDLYLYIGIGVGAVIALLGLLGKKRR
ncbi:MAG: zf-HC2 domain-containing protein [Lachnospiraceae bacterium]|nr:zf-HC2 domain-containing protein [Lachnospiraceae bacterium]